jgi:hypothetical protein
VEEDTGPPICVNEPKEKRFKEERNMKVSLIQYPADFVLRTFPALNLG